MLKERKSFSEDLTGLVALAPYVSLEILVKGIYTIEQKLNSTEPLTQTERVMLLFASAVMSKIFLRRTE